MEPGEFSEYASHEFRPLPGMANEIAVIGRASGQKRNLLFGFVGSQGRDPGQGIALVAQQQQGLQRRMIGAAHRHRPLPGVENFRTLHLEHQGIPLIAELLVLRNLHLDA